MALNPLNSTGSPERESVGVGPVRTAGGKNDALDAEARDAYLAECREVALEEIRRLLPDSGPLYEALYRLVLDYPLRGGKGLRPALAVASCRVLGGTLDQVRRSAAVLELYHNAFLVHDDIEDESEERRGQQTLHQQHGVPIAINVGDAMLGLSLEPLLENVEFLGLGPALGVLRAVARMTRESVEGQAIELDWIRRGVWQLEDADYTAMVIKKTGWYSFMTPIHLGCVAAGAPEQVRDEMVELGRLLAVAFQIQDDVLNLEQSATRYGKEFAGDLWEGKRTLILLHALREAKPARRRRMLDALAKARPTEREAARLARLEATVGQSAAVEGAARARFTEELRESWAADWKTEEDVQELMDGIEQAGSLDYARRVAAEWSNRAAEQFERLCAGSWGGKVASQALLSSVHRDFLGSLVDYVHRREL